MFEDKYHPGVKKDLKKLDRPVIEEIRTVHIQKILTNPFTFDALHGDLAGLYSYHFRQNRVDYRISYMVNQTSQMVFVLMIGTRENFYNILKKRLHV